MKEYQCTINWSVCLADGNNNLTAVLDHTREYLCENVRDGRQVFNFRGRKKAARRQRTDERDKKKREREKGNDRYPIITEDRLAWPKIIHMKPRHRRSGLSRIENCTPGHAV